MPGPIFDRPMVISYRTLRKLVGILGILLPLLVSLGAWLLDRTTLRHSISDYYYTVTRDEFVGALCSIGLFLFSYKGPEPQDGIAGNVAGVSAFGVALFPKGLRYSPHYVFAALLFLTLSYFSLFLFTKTSPDKTPTPRKLQRNLVYRICGYTILASILLVPAVNLFPGISGPIPSPVFWLETLAIVVFGVSWLIKGETFLRDRPDEVSAAESLG